MKCIHYHKTPMIHIQRVSNDEAKAAVDSGKARYVPKSYWKRHVRGPYFRLKDQVVGN